MTKSGLSRGTLHHKQIIKMKRLFTALLCSLTLCSFAQNDSLSLGAGANNMVFYNLATHTKTTAANDDWHIAFSAQYINGFSYPLTSIAAAVRINEAYGLKLFRSPTQKLAQYSTFDTTGWRGWQQMHNPDTTWNIGAFNINRDTADQFNYGWGEYNGVSHNIYSDSSVYLIQLPDGSFKKFALLNLIYDTAFNVQYANLDNSGATIKGISKSPASNVKSFYYLNLNNDSIMDKEPALTDWDLMAFRYTNTGYNAANTTQDIGILTNENNSQYAASGATAQQNCYQGIYSTRINVIGKTWMGAPGDTLIPGLAYFIQTPSSGYKFTVTGFGGATTGVINFTVGTCAIANGISEISSADMSIYPVPASDLLNVRVSSTEESNTTIELLDMTGRVIVSQNAAMHTGENNFAINLQSVQSGNYIVALSSAAGKVNRMISVVK